MRWKIVSKAAPPGPTRAGTYRDWKQLLAVECHWQCVYCAIPDRRFGGTYNFHVEHFEPRSKAKHRINEWANLYYACAICNVLKGNDWPAVEGPFSYLDPAKVDYEGRFDRAQGGTIAGRDTHSKYHVQKLGLNRSQLVLERRQSALMDRWYRVQDVLSEVMSLIGPPLVPAEEALDVLHEVAAAIHEVELAVRQLNDVPLYEQGDTKR